MNIRLMGLPAEIQQAIKVLTEIRDQRFVIAEISTPRRNHGDSRQVRVYIEVRVTEWCDRNAHDGDCCPGSRQEYSTRRPPQRKELPQ
jgi:hypothetical protein